MHQNHYRWSAWSAKTDTSLSNYAKNLAAYTEKNPGVTTADVAFTLQATRADFNIRRFVIAGDNADLQPKLLAENVDASTTKKLAAKPSEIVFMFPGQGSQYVNMGKELYENEPVFKAAVDECINLLTATPQAHILDV